MVVTNTNRNAMSYWTCDAVVPNAKGTARIKCGNENSYSQSKCAACGAPRQITTTTKDKNTMSDTVKPSKTHTQTTNPATHKSEHKAPPAASTSPAAATATATSPATTTAAPTEAKKTDPNDPASYKGLPRLKFYSTKPGCTDYCARVLPIFHEKYGAPKDPWGGTMELRNGASADKPLKKVEKAEKKENEKKLLAAMTDEQKAAYVKEKREKRAAEKTAKETSKREAMMASLKAELESQGYKIIKDAPSA
jgi:hypothetical protein